MSRWPVVLPLILGLAGFFALPVAAQFVPPAETNTVTTTLGDVGTKDTATTDMAAPAPRTRTCRTILPHKGVHPRTVSRMGK